jgi:ABC-type Mn2+/Zn2+ transport system ATPase subunit
LEDVAKPIIRFDRVRLGYGDHVVLDEIVFAVLKGDFLGIIGPNGAGKTTVLRAILGLIRPIAGALVREDALRFGYVMQRQALDTLFPFTVEEVVRMGRSGWRRPWQRWAPEDLDAVSYALDITGLSDLRDQHYRQLSGGQKQRTLIARALASRPEVLVLDEPTNDMDLKGEARILDLLRDVQARLGVTVILVSHLLHVVLNYSDRLLLLLDGRAHHHTIHDLASGDLLSRIYGVPVRIGQSGDKKYLVTG